MLQPRPLSDRVDSMASIGALATQRSHMPTAQWKTAAMEANKVSPTESIGYRVADSGYGSFAVERAPSVITGTQNVAGTMPIAPVVAQATSMNGYAPGRNTIVPATTDDSLSRVFFRNVQFNPEKASVYADLVSRNKDQADVHSATLRAGGNFDMIKWKNNEKAYAEMYRQKMDQLSSLVKQPRLTRQTVGYDSDGKVLKRILTKNPMSVVTRRQREGILKTRQVRYNVPTDDRRAPPKRAPVLVYGHPIKDDRADASIADEIEVNKLNALVKTVYETKLAKADDLRRAANGNMDMTNEYKKRGYLQLVQSGGMGAVPAIVPVSTTAGAVVPSSSSVLSAMSTAAPLIVS